MPTFSCIDSDLGNRAINLSFRYMGHSGGENYARGQVIRGINTNAKVLLMGCSSGFLKDRGEFDPSGIVIDYLMAGRYFKLISRMDSYVLKARRLSLICGMLPTRILIRSPKMYCRDFRGIREVRKRWKIHLGYLIKLPMPGMFANYDT